MDKLCTTSGNPIDEHTRDIDPNTGQQRDYVILCEEERAKGFVKPVQDTYTHVGRPACGKPLEGNEPPAGKVAFLCNGKPGHDGPCSSWLPVTAVQLAYFQKHSRLRGCGATTKMARTIAETYAREPSFYTGTYCFRCQEHFPVGPEGEFEWADGSKVGA